MDASLGCMSKCIQQLRGITMALVLRGAVKQVLFKFFSLIRVGGVTNPKGVSSFVWVRMLPTPECFVLS